MKRIFCVTLALVLVLTCTVSVFAETPGQYDVIDLLGSGFFSDGESTSITKSALTYTFTWDVTATSSLAYVYVNIYAPSLPGSVTLNGVAGTRVYSGAFYQYRFAMSRVIDDISIVVRFPSSVNRTVSIGYCIGTVSGQEALTKFNLSSRGYKDSASWNTTNNLSIPYAGKYGSTIPSDVAQTYRVNDFEFQFDFDMAAADYFTVHFVVPCVAGGANIDFRHPFATDPAFFLGSGGTYTYPLEVINFESWASNDNLLPWRNVWHFCYTVDVSGYRLDQLQLYVPFTLFGIETDTANFYRFYFYLLSACVGVYPDDGGWWRGFTGWLGDKLSDIGSAISSGFTSLKTTVTSQFTSLKSSLSRWFSDLGDRIDAVVNPPPDKEVTDSQDEVSDGLGQLEDFEQSSFDQIDNGISVMQGDITSGVSTFLPALSFIQKYTNHIGDAISDYIIVFILPIFIGIFLFVCNRAPNVTRLGDRFNKE